MGVWGGGGGGGGGGGRGGGAFKGEGGGAARYSLGRGLALAPAANGLLEGRGKPRLPAAPRKIPAGALGAGGTALRASCPGWPPGLRCSGRDASSFRDGEVGRADAGSLSGDFARFWPFGTHICFLSAELLWGPRVCVVQRTSSRRVV